jgi:hypothetical protein
LRYVFLFFHAAKINIFSVIREKFM